jgi:hypothetical protein
MRDAIFTPIPRNATHVLHSYFGTAPKIFGSKSRHAAALIFNVLASASPRMFVQYKAPALGFKAKQFDTCIVDQLPRMISAGVCIGLVLSWDFL